MSSLGKRITEYRIAELEYLPVQHYLTFYKVQWNLSKADTIGTMPFGSVSFREITFNKV